MWVAIATILEPLFRALVEALFKRFDRPSDVTKPDPTPRLARLDRVDVRDLLRRGHTLLRDGDGAPRGTRNETA